MGGCKRKQNNNFRLSKQAAKGVIEVYADDRDEAEDQVLEELADINKGSVFLDDDWREEEKDVVTVSRG